MKTALRIAAILFALILFITGCSADHKQPIEDLQTSAPTASAGEGEQLEVIATEPKDETPSEKPSEPSEATKETEAHTATRRKKLSRLRQHRASQAQLRSRHKRRPQSPPPAAAAPAVSRNRPSLLPPAAAQSRPPNRQRKRKLLQSQRNRRRWFMTSMPPWQPVTPTLCRSALDQSSTASIRRQGIAGIILARLFQGILLPAGVVKVP